MLPLHVLKVASGSFSPKLIIPLVSNVSEHKQLCQPMMKNFFWSNSFIKLSTWPTRVIAGAGTARGTSGVITFGEKDPETTLPRIWESYASPHHSSKVN